MHTPLGDHPAVPYNTGFTTKLHCHTPPSTKGTSTTWREGADGPPITSSSMLELRTPSTTSTTSIWLTGSWDSWPQTGCSTPTRGLRMLSPLWLTTNLLSKDSLWSPWWSLAMFKSLRVRTKAKFALIAILSTLAIDFGLVDWNGFLKSWMFVIAQFHWPVLLMILLLY